MYRSTATSMHEKGRVMRIIFIMGSQLSKRSKPLKLQTIKVKYAY